MKSQFARIKNRASSVSTRALAVMLCFVMLLTAVGAGTMMTAIAAGGVTTPVADAAQKVIDIADSVDVTATEVAEDEESAATETVFDKLNDRYKALAASIPQVDTSADEDEPAPSRKKADKAATGANKFQREDIKKIEFVGDNISGSGFDTYVYSSSSTFNNHTGDFYVYNPNGGTSRYDYHIKLKLLTNDNNITVYASNESASFGTESGECNNATNDDSNVKNNHISLWYDQNHSTFHTNATTSKYVHVYYCFWGNYSDIGRLGMYQSAVSSLSYSSLTAGTNSLEPGGTTTLTSTGSGGSGSYSYSYSVKKKSDNSTVSDCISGNTFTAPNVTTSTTYVITGTISDDNCPNITKSTATKTYEITVAPKANYYVWGGNDQEFNETSYNTTLTYNAATGKYDGTYTFGSENWHSILISKASSSSSFDREWTSYNQVGWALDSYNSNTVYKNYSSSHREPSSGEMSDSIIKYVDVNNYSSSWGLKIAATAEGSMVNLSYDPATQVLYLWGATGSDKATIYAKDGAINEGRKTTRVLGTTTVASADNVWNVARQTIAYSDDLVSGSSTTECYTYARATKGTDITVTTTVNDAYASKYFVKGWDVNGTTYGIDPTAVGNAYSATFTVPDVDKVEITPIYWLKSGNVTTFIVKDFNNVPAEWGSALYYYYWGGSQVNVDTEEKYPGQPFVNDGGQYYAQVPTDVTGITLNNAIWDTIHGETMMGVTGTENKQNRHYQTYDYDNFAKISAEKSGINSIYFTFKYENTKNNFTNSSGTTSPITLADYGTSGNGWEDYKDPLGRANNIFGGTTVTTGGKVLYAVSNGYVRNYQGNFATEWSIYVADSSSATTASYVTTIPSSALVLDAEADFDKTSYSSGYTPALSTYKSAWNTLNTSTYKTLPVKVTYEKAVKEGWSQITNSGSCPSGAGGQDSSHSDPAYRIDGKWDYVLNSDYSTANIIIQKSTDNGASYTNDTFVTNTNQGTTTQATAFFNNTGASYVNKHEVTTGDAVVVSTTNKYKLKTVPQPSTGYQFVGWYRLDDGSETPSFISSSTEAESMMSAKATFIARYKHVTEGYLYINHNVDGAGVSTNHTVKVEIFAGDADIEIDKPIRTLTGESVDLDRNYISSASTYKLRVTLTAIADASSYIANTSAVPTVACSQATATYYKNPVYTRTGRFNNSVYPQNVVTTVDTFTIASLYSGETQNFTVLNYTTTFNKLPTYTIYYKYHGRGQSGSDYLTFTRTITLSPDEAEGKDSTGASYSGNGGTALRPTYIVSTGSTLVNDITANAPDTNNLETDVFNKNIAWSAPSSVDASPLTVYANETDPNYTLTYSYVNDLGEKKSNKTVTAAYNTLITLDGKNSTFATAPAKNGVKFAYWADESGKPLTATREYKMRLVNNVTIQPVYEAISAGWDSAIEKITRTHQTSDNSDYVYTDFALRFTGFDDSGRFITINPNYNDRYRVGVALVYDTEGNNTTNTTVEGDTALYAFPSSGYSYTDAQSMIQLLVSRSLTTARLSGISATTYVTMNDADNTKLTNFNRMDYAVKYNYNTYYKRSYDAYAYVIDKTDNSVLAVSPVKSGYIFDGTLPVGN